VDQGTGDLYCVGFVESRYLNGIDDEHSVLAVRNTVSFGMSTDNKRTVRLNRSARLGGACGKNDHPGGYWGSIVLEGYGSAQRLQTAATTDCHNEETAQTNDEQKR
jgi:hypothetical protein